MSYTFKKVQWEQSVRNYQHAVNENTKASNPTYTEETSDIFSIVDSYNDVSYKEAVSVIARKQPKSEIVKDTNGHEMLSKSVYYIDPSIEHNALSINKMDKLDGELIIDIYVMCNLYNKPRMIRCITI
jgi:hypothetical protein